MNKTAVLEQIKNECENFGMMHQRANVVYQAIAMILLTIPLLNKLLFSLREPQGALLC